MSRAGEWEVEDSALRARRASSFGAEAAAYDEHRPDYPVAGVHWALGPVDGKPDVEVLDLGAGTGKLTGVMLAAGLRVTAVEPDAAMRAVLMRRYPAVSTLAGSAESIPLQDDSVDAVMAGQAFHWFDLPRAFPEIARVLRPAGVVAAFWNGHDTSVEWVAELDRVSYTTASFERRSTLGLPAHPLFYPFERTEFAHSHRRTAESLTDTIGTNSHTLVVSPAERTAALERIAAYLSSRPETATGEFDFPLRTLVIRALVK
ncbi:MAG: class SAM-dependent methyltransferase [Nocardia sp.]|uniref:class I SAM-dependent methyltransferase n=1 Tax=Nocardia sp. TaxID=1821 RepID=UPI002613D185|nr:class I SAM-dependent methyltransferase [Nocardia sp.]MCU1647382.1 class SAM-dependent methyltransferase [Nocardia sp.]